VPALTQSEAEARSALIAVESCQVFLDLTAEPVRSRSEIRFRCREPGAATFADLATAGVRGAVLNGRPLGQPADGRLVLAGLAAENLLAVDAEVAYSGTGRGLVRFTDPADGAGYVTLTCYPTHAPSVFCCFDQPDLTAAATVSVAAPAGWECVSNGPVEQRPQPGLAGVWRFGTVPGTRCWDPKVLAGPYVTTWQGSAGDVSIAVRHRRSLDGAPGAAGLARFGELVRRFVEHYGQALGVPCPYEKYDVVFAPELLSLASSIPGLMMVSESLLARMADSDDEFVAMVCAHEVAHLWFGCHVGMRWWDDVWLDEAIATYMSYSARGTGPWTAFCYQEKAGAYRADELPGRRAVASPVASAADALARPPALTYNKGASVARQLAALVGEEAVRTGLSGYLRRFGGGSASTGDLVACWSRAAGRDLAGWAEQWLRTEGAPVLRVSMAAAPDGTIASLAVLADGPRTQRIGIGLYDRDGGGLRRRRLAEAELSGPRTVVESLAGEPVPDAVVLNDGDLGYAQVRFDERSLGALAGAAMQVGDPLTEAVCWNAAWQMVLHGELAAADFAALVIRRLSGGPLPTVAAEVLLGRAAACADRYAPAAERAELRSAVASAALAGAEQAPRGGTLQRALAAGFAASAQHDGQLSLLRCWLAGTSLPGGLAVRADLHGRILRTLSARGLAVDGDLDALVTADPVSGRETAATCRAMRPDPAAKQAAWQAALAPSTQWRLALGHARGIWVPGQEELLAGYRDRYVTEALPALDGRRSRVAEYLARELYPATLADPRTLAVTGAALRRGRLSSWLRVIVAELDAELGSVLAARAAAGRDWPRLPTHGGRAQTAAGPRDQPNPARRPPGSRARRAGQGVQLGWRPR
jgi:aminopeptidase N